jgi:acyl carrier protein
MTDAGDSAATLDRVIRDSLGLPDDQDLRPISYGQTPEWDSVAYLQMMAAIEEAFGIELATDDVTQMTDYERIRATLRERYGLTV